MAATTAGTADLIATLDTIKTRQRAAWAAGDFGIIGTTLQIVGETLCEAVDLRAGSNVLDVAAGNGNCSLAAARRWCDVTSTDYVVSLLDDGRRRAEAERFSIRFQEADAEALPFADASYDVVLSSFGVGGQRDGARVPLQRPHRTGQLDAAWIHRAAVQGRWPACATATRADVTVSLGARRPPRFAVWSGGIRHPHHAARLRLPLSLAGALA